MEDDKKFRYRGKTIEELQELSMEEFVSLLPSRDRRKFARGLKEQEQKLLDRVNAGEKNIRTHCRDFIVLPNMVGMKISIYNGKQFVPVTIIEEMIGMRLGELAPTRAVAKHPEGKK